MKKNQTQNWIPGSGKQNGILPKVLSKRKEPHPTRLVNTGKRPPRDGDALTKTCMKKGDSGEPPGSHNKSRLEIFLPPHLLM